MGNFIPIFAGRFYAVCIRNREITYFASIFIKKAFVMKSILIIGFTLALFLPAKRLHAQDSLRLYEYAFLSLRGKEKNR